LNNKIFLTFIGVFVSIAMLTGFSTNQPEPVTEATVSVIPSSPIVLEKKTKVIKTYKKNEQLKPKALVDILKEAGFKGDRLVEAFGIAMKESTGRPRSHNDNPDTGDNSYGLFQINMIGDLGPARLEKYNLESNKDLFDPLINAKIAYQMSNKGKNWSAWHGLTDSALKWMKEFPE
jgi:hypothetical protein